MSSDDLKPRLESAVAFARQAGDFTLTHFQRDDLAVETKADASPVTVADRGAEQLLRSLIAAAFPTDGILGEELGEQPGTSGYRWILDPIDGTKSFIHGVPLFGTLVGIERGGRSVVGVIHIPALAETAYAAAGQGAWYVKGDAAPRRARVSPEETARRPVPHFRSEKLRRDRSGRRLRAVCNSRPASRARGATPTATCSSPSVGPR